jgi:tripartite-type tricarboxylate transporter receptor subunit TctC
MNIRSSLNVGLFLASALASMLTYAQDAYPSKPVKLIIPFSAGSTADLIARLLGDYLSTHLKQPFIVDNRAGAGGSVGMGIAARSPADGYTLLLTTSSPLVINPTLQTSVPYNVEKDFVPISMIAWVPAILVTNPALPAKDLRELISLLKKNPGKYSYASSGQGTYTHILMEMFRQSLGIDLIHIPYKGPSQAETDVVAGQVALMFDGIATANPLIQAGRLRPYGVTSKARTAFAPSIPTFSEQNIPGLKNFEARSWVSLLAPAGTPSAVVSKLNREINEALKSTEFKAKLFTKNFEAYEPNTSNDITLLIGKEKAHWAKVIRDANIQPE